jgi:hypothetical protein
MIYDLWIDSHLKIKIAPVEQAEDCNEAGLIFVNSIDVESLDDLDPYVSLAQSAVDASLQMLNDNANQLKINTKITNGDIN